MILAQQYGQTESTTGNWIYQKQIDETVDWFVRTALPDAQPGWEDLPWSVDEMGRTDDRGRWWTIAVDVPTSVKGMDCWLSFRVVEPGGEIREPFVRGVHASDRVAASTSSTPTSGTTARACG